jgi:hypothetical protein
VKGFARCGNFNKHIRKVSGFHGNQKSDYRFADSLKIKRFFASGNASEFKSQPQIGSCDGGILNDINGYIPVFAVGGEIDHSQHMGQILRTKKIGCRIFVPVV